MKGRDYFELAEELHIEIPEDVENDCDYLRNAITERMGRGIWNDEPTPLTDTLHEFLTTLITNTKRVKSDSYYLPLYEVIANTYKQSVFVFVQLFMTNLDLLWI